MLGYLRKLIGRKEPAAQEWWMALGRHVGNYVGAIVCTHSQVIGDGAQILEVESSSKPGHVYLVTQGGATGCSKAEFYAALKSPSEPQKDNMIDLLRSVANASQQFVLTKGHTVAFSESDEPLWLGSIFSGVCIGERSITGPKSAVFETSEFGAVKLLPVYPVTKSELAYWRKSGTSSAHVELEAAGITPALDTSRSSLH